MECPICGSTELYVDDEIPDDPPFNDISMEEVEIIKTQIVDHLELLITEPLTDERKKIIDDIHNYLIKWRNEKDN